MADPAAPSPGLLAPLSVRDYRLLWAGESVSVLGTQFHIVALPWLVLQLTGSRLALGTVLTAAAVPRAALMLAGGAFTDRFSPRALMLVSNAVRAVVVGGLTALVFAHRVTLAQLLAVALVFGTFDALFYPAFTTIVPSLVPGPMLRAANALLQLSAQTAGLLAPAPAGLLVAAAGVPWALAADAGSFVVAAVALFFIRERRRAAAPAGEAGVFARIGEGLRYAWADPGLRRLLAMSAAVNLSFTGPFVVGMASLSAGRFAGGPTALGILYSAMGGGALLGTATAGTLRRIPRRGPLLIVLYATVAAAMGVIAVAEHLWVAAAAVLLMGTMAGFASVVVMAWLQARVEPALTGRVMSVVMLNAVGLQPLSFLAAGAIAEVSTTLLFAASAVLVGTVAAAGAASRTVREIA